MISVVYKLVIVEWMLTVMNYHDMLKFYTTRTQRQ